MKNLLIILLFLAGIAQAQVTSTPDGIEVPSGEEIRFLDGSTFAIEAGTTFELADSLESAWQTELSLVPGTHVQIGRAHV